MKKNQNFFSLKSITLILVFLFLSNVFFAQTDSVQVVQTDPKPAEVQQVKEKSKKKKRKDEFKVFAGVNFNQLSIDSEMYKSTLAVGYLLGVSYKRGKFFYWEIGARLNNPVYNLDDLTIPPDSSSLLDGVFSVRNIDVPITFGINFLSITSRIVGLRVFVSAIPAFALGVGGNDLGISKDDINTFNLYGQGGVGVDVAFLFLEAGFNYGFTDLFKNEIESNPYQVFVNLGFRF
jgi:hypothetical protein